MRSTVEGARALSAPLSVLAAAAPGVNHPPIFLRGDRR